MPAMQVLADHNQMDQLLDGLADAIREGLADAGPSEPWAIVGIRSRGDVLARRLEARLPADAIQGRVGAVDITLYRDDLSEAQTQPVVRTTEIPFNTDGMQLVLVDDVLMTGRSVRAALQSIMDLGRPRRVWLAVLVDRGGRELPIAPDFVGLDLRDSGTIAADSRVDVRVTPTDSEDAILVRARGDVVGEPGGKEEHRE